MDEHENDIKSALTGFGERPVRAYSLCELGKLTNGAVQWDWGEDSACKCYVTYYMTEYCLRYCVFLHKYSWLTVVMHTRLRIANSSLLEAVVIVW